LSIAESDDGRVLIHCFVGCAAADILAAVGISLSDLYPERIKHATTDADRKELRRLAREGQWAAALGVLTREAQIVESAVSAFQAERFTAIDYSRLQTAFHRIHSAAEVLLQ
jgi:capsule polysaccharide modification protein KpsS